VYLFNTQDDPHDSSSANPIVNSHSDVNMSLLTDHFREPSEDGPSPSITDGDTESALDSSSGGSVEGSDGLLHSKKAAASVVLPRLRFSGACNVDTVKDGEMHQLNIAETNCLMFRYSSVNFLGHTDQFVASGSDDGNVFVWLKSTGKLVNILEGDGSVVNVLEQNPCYSCVAVSGIDHSVKVYLLRIRVTLAVLTSFSLDIWKEHCGWKRLLPSSR
jgi:WD40 repeat protein